MATKVKVNLYDAGIKEVNYSICAEFYSLEACNNK